MMIFERGWNGNLLNLILRLLLFIFHFKDQKFALTIPTMEIYKMYFNKN